MKILLLAGLDEHSAADIHQAATINPIWIFKFHVAKRKVKEADQEGSCIGWLLRSPSDVQAV